MSNLLDISDRLEMYKLLVFRVSPSVVTTTEEKTTIVPLASKSPASQERNIIDALPFPKATQDSYNIPGTVRDPIT